MKRYSRSEVTVFAISLAVFEAIALVLFFTHVVNKLIEMDIDDAQKTQIALVLVSFHSYYHVWPCAPGPLDSDAEAELAGSDDAKINTKHINFFDRNNCHEALYFNGHTLFFKTDDSIGTCVVYGNSH